MSFQILHRDDDKKIRSAGALIAAENANIHSLRTKYFIPLRFSGTELSEPELRILYAEAITEAIEKKCRSAVLVIDDNRSPYIAANTYLSVPDHEKLRLYLLAPATQTDRLRDRISAFIERRFSGRYETDTQTFPCALGSISEFSAPDSSPKYDSAPDTKFSQSLKKPLSADADETKQLSAPSIRRKSEIFAPNAAFAPNHSPSAFNSPFSFGAAPVQSGAPAKDTLAARLRRQEETFTQAMLRIISKNGWTEAEVYNRIFMDRRLFNKIRNHPNYQPKKPTAILLAFALRLNYDETLDFIGKAGYTLTHSSKSDLIVEYFLQTANYDILELNEALYEFGQPSILKD